MTMQNSRWPSLNVQPAASGFSAMIVGCDLNAEVDDALFSQIRQALIEHQVLVFKNVALTADAQINLARRFGHVQVHVMNQYHNKAHPELYTLSNLDDNGRPSGRHPDKGTLVWHTDGSWMSNPGLVTMMFAEQVPQVGGETHFCDMYSAWKNLPHSRQQQLKPLRAIHNLDFSRQRRHGEEPMTDEQRRRVPPVEHPVVCRHPDSQLPCVYLGDHAESIAGLSYSAGRDLVDAVNEQIAGLGHRYEHRWQANELVIWDNRCVLHKATPYDTATSKRVIRRCTVLRDDLPQAYF